MRVLELFGGYGSQALALENLGIDFKSDLCEIDKYAIQAYNQLHGETFNYGDICSIDEKKLPYYDLITFSPPCQDFSQAGKQAGGEKGSGTRSSLLWECERIIRAVNPKYLLMENVKALTSKKFMPLFAKWLKTLEDMGYKNWWKVLNAKDYGVPQNRERVFVVSILGGGSYQFPEPIKLEKRLKDVLEQNVDEKYYINKTIDLPQKDISNTIRAGGRGSQDIKHTWDIIKEPVACASRGRNPDNPSDRTTGSPTEQRIEINTNGTTNTITTVQKDNYVIEPMALDEQNQYIRKDGCVGTLTTDGSSQKHNNRVVEPKVQQLWNLIDTESFGGNPQTGRVYSSDGLSPTLNTMQGGGREPKIVDDIYPNREPRVYGESCPTLRANHSGDLKVVDYRKERRKDGFTDKRIYTLLRVLWKTIREKQVWNEIGRFRCVSEKEILQQGLYEKGNAEIGENEPNIFKCTHNSEKDKQIIIEQEFLRAVWERISARRSSQRWGLSEQQFGKLNDCLQKLPYETAQTKEKMYFVWKAGEGFELLRETLSEIQKIWKSTNDKQRTREFGYRIRKLTPRECWRLQGVRDEQFDKLLEKKNFIMEGDNLCNVKFVDVAEKQKQSDTGTCVCFTIKDLLGTETPIPTRMQKEIEIGKNKNVKFAIEKLADVGHLGIATNIIKCSENGEMLYTLMEELGQHNMAIIELEKEVNENTERFLKITLEESFCQARLSTILILIALITRLKIYTYIKAKANIQSNIVITEDSSKNMTLKILSLEMEYIIQKISSSQLYKLAGNSIVVDVLMAIFKNLFMPTEQKGQLELL